MVVFLFCVLSFTRTAIVNLSRRLFGAKDQRTQQPEVKDSRNTTDEQCPMDRHAPSTSIPMDQGSKRNSKDNDLTDASNFHDPSPEEDDIIARYLPKPIIVVKSPVMKDDTHYNMNHKRRGRCVILNHDKFDMEENRNGTMIDVDKITSVFKDLLGFDVICHHNLTTTDIIETTKRLSEEDHKDNDCFCMFILTHGTSGDTLYSKDCQYPLRTIWQRFTGDHCQTLIGKPKLFFVQACRGDSYDGGVGVYSTGHSETDSVATAAYKIPTHADFLIAHSTMEGLGFFSWRSPTDGTVYVQQLCKVIEENWQTHDLAEMMTLTARLVANEYSSWHYIPQKHEQKQMPSTTSTLTRKILFTKKNKTT